MFRLLHYLFSIGSRLRFHSVLTGVCTRWLHPSHRVFRSPLNVANLVNVCKFDNFLRIWSIFTNLGNFYDFWQFSHFFGKFGEFGWIMPKWGQFLRIWAIFLNLANLTSGPKCILGKTKSFEYDRGGVTEFRKCPETGETTKSLKHENNNFKR